VCWNIIKLPVKSLAKRQGFVLDTDHTKIYHGLPGKISSQALSNDEALDSASEDGV